MQVTIDIPESRYRELALEAQALCTTVQELVTRKLHLSATSKKKSGECVRFPLIRSSLPGNVDAAKEDVLDLLDPA